MSGRCRFCGCTEGKACPGGCWWADRLLELCSQCVAINDAWQRQRTRPPNMVRAFFRGYVAATRDVRAVDGPHTNPYAEHGDTRRFWWLGNTAAKGALPR